MSCANHEDIFQLQTHPCVLWEAGPETRFYFCGFSLTDSANRGARREAAGLEEATTEPAPGFFVFLRDQGPLVVHVSSTSAKPFPMMAPPVFIAAGPILRSLSPRPRGPLLWAQRNQLRRNWALSLPSWSCRSTGPRLPCSFLPSAVWVAVATSSCHLSYTLDFSFYSFNSWQLYTSLKWFMLHLFCEITDTGYVSVWILMHQVSKTSLLIKRTSIASC